MSSLGGCITHLSALIAHRTVNPGGDEIGLCKLLQSMLLERGADSAVVETVERSSERGPNSSGAYVYATFGTPTLLLNVHLDTVPANSGWTRDPFEAEVTSDRVYGLGSCDIKGAIAAILAVLENGGARNLGVLFSGDEENGSRCIPHFLATHDTKSIEKALVFEPTARCAGLRHRGMHSLRAHYVGKGGHSSKADSMEKPIVELSKLAVALDRMGISAMSEGPTNMKGLCMNVAKLDGGVAYNVVPDLGELSFSIRPAPGFDRDAFLAELKQASEACHPKIEIEPITVHHPFACGDADGIRALVGDYAEHFVDLDFWTEAALLQAAGIDSVVIGPGDIAQAHTADEYVLLSDLRWAMDLVSGVIAQHAS